MEFSLDMNIWNIDSNAKDNRIHGVGYIDDSGRYEFNNKAYQVWYHMLQLAKKNKTENIVCDEWKNYNNFKTWYEENYYEIKGENVLFSCMCIKKNNTHFCPQLCVFAPPSIIGLLYGGASSKKDKCVYGVSKSKNKYGYSYKCSMKIAPELNCGSSTFYIGSFETEEEAFVNYKIVKELYIKGVAYHYKDVIPTKLYNSMLNWIVEKGDNEIVYENSDTRKDIFRL